MIRSGRLILILATLTLPGLAPLPGRAQSPGSPATTSGKGSEAGQFQTQQSQPQADKGSAPEGDETAVVLKPPPLEPGDRCFPINLATALRLSDARPLIVAIAQAQAWIAEARLQRAKVYWVPALMMNAAYLRHDGPVDFNSGVNIPEFINAQGQPDPNSFGKPLNQNLNWFYSGMSLYQVFALTDAIFLPLSAQQELNTARWDVQTARNDALMRTARAYFDVHRARGLYAGALYTVERGQKLVEALKRLSRDLVPGVEIDRATNLLADLEQMAVSAREEWRVSSAELTRVLRLDPRAVVEPLEHDHLQITLVDPSRSLDELIPIGLTHRPELASQQAIVQAALVRIRQEKLRPILPSILITGWQSPGGMTDQIGIFATGSGGKMNNWSFRDDISVQVVWQLEGFGLGNAARIKRERANESRALVELFRKQDEIAAEIAQVQANLQSAGARVPLAERSLREALITFNRSLEGLGQTQRFGDVLELIYRPQEVTNALMQLKVALDEYFNTVADYNVAQFELLYALGYPAQEISDCMPPGEVLQVETTRPDYLPPVGTGPPPATR